jgi:hypothetical protein
LRVRFNSVPLREQLRQDFLTKAEDSFDVAADEQGVNERSTWNGVANIVDDARARIGPFEKMLVAPVAVGTAALLVDKSAMRLPGGNLRAPVHRKAAKA